MIIVDVELKNPVSAGWTGHWKVDFLEDLLDDAKIIDSTEITKDEHSVQTGNIWVGNLPAPNLFRIWRNQIPFKDRKQGSNEWAEIHIRLMTKYPLPAS